MARYGYLFCVTCKEAIFLGKWLHDDDVGGIGFWHGQLCPEGVADAPALGRKALKFLARHMDHDLVAASDEGGRADALFDDAQFDTDKYHRADDAQFDTDKYHRADDELDDAARQGDA